MDVRIAAITGTIFAGVLVAGALAAPRFDPGQTRQEQDPSAGLQLVDDSLVLADYGSGYDDDDDRYDDDDDEHGHDDDNRGDGRNDDDHDDDEDD